MLQPSFVPCGPAVARPRFHAGLCSPPQRLTSLRDTQMYRRRDYVDLYEKDQAKWALIRNVNTVMKQSTLLPVRHAGPAGQTHTAEVEPRCSGPELAQVKCWSCCDP